MLNSYSHHDGVSTSMTSLINPENQQILAQFGMHRGQIWLKMLSKPRTLLDEGQNNTSIMSDEKILSTAYLIEYQGDVYSFHGFFKKQQLQVWKNGQEIVYLNNIKVQKGFSCVTLYLPETKEGEKVTFLIGFGLGIGKADIWKLSMNNNDQQAIEFSRIGSIRCGKSYSALGFDITSTKIIGISGDAGDPIAQLYELLPNMPSFELTSTQGTRLGGLKLEERLTEALGCQYLSKSLMNRHEAFINAGGWHSNIYNWSELFPPRIIDLYAYDGSMNADGEPDGYGEQYIKAENAIYQGMWKRGNREGEGKLIDSMTEKIIFQGNFKKNEKKGFGIEYSDNHTYSGHFNEDVREGFGEMKFTKMTSFASFKLEPGSICKGFFKQGRLNGFSRLEFPKGQFGIKFQEEIGCIVQFSSGICHGRFWFYLVNSENELENCPVQDEPIDDSIPLIGSGRRFLDVGKCWICLGESKQGLKQCKECGFVMHFNSCSTSPYCLFCGDQVSLTPYVVDSTTVLPHPNKRIKSLKTPSTSAKLVNHVNSVEEEKKKDERRGVLDALQQHQEKRDRELQLIHAEGKERIDSLTHYELQLRRQQKTAKVLLQNEVLLLEEKLLTIQQEFQEKYQSVKPLLIDQLHLASDDLLLEHQTELWNQWNRWKTGL